jgi:cell wall assembly regulator SMI1
MIQFRISYPPASEQQVSQLEALIGRRLPDDYRTFLLTYNGGLQPREEKFNIPEVGGSLIQVFFGFYGGYDDILSQAERLSDWLPLCLPIARDLCGNYIGLRLTDERFGSVHWFDHELNSDFTERPPIEVSESFAYFQSFFDRHEPEPHKVA